MYLKKKKKKKNVLVDKDIKILDVSGCVLDVYSLRFHSLVDYLTSFSGIDVSSLMFAEDDFCCCCSAKLTSRSNGFISSRHVCTN